MSRAGGVGPSFNEGVSGSNQAIDESTNGTETNSLSRNEVFEILSNHRRRFALHHLQHNGDQAELGDLAEHVAAWENDIDVDEVSSTERKRVYTSLQQFHLPKLNEKGVVSYDEREGVVELDSLSEGIDIYLEVVEGRDIPWSQYYVVLGVVDLAMVAAAFMGLSPFTALPMAGWGIFVAVTFLVSALAHAYLHRTKMRLGNPEKPPELST